MILEATNIVKRFGGVTALAGVDVTVAVGEVLGLIGPNGSGKTTLVNCVSGVLATDEGEIRLGDRRMTRASRARRAKAGLARTFQNPRLFGELTVRENVAAGLNSSRRGRLQGRELTDRLLGRLELTQLGRDVVSSLPYGLQRRVEIARALAGEPTLLLLDEPAAGLNDSETEGLYELLRELRNEGSCGILVIDHDMTLIMKASDRVQVLDEGQVIFMGKPEDAFKQPQVVEAYLGVSESDVGDG